MKMQCDGCKKTKQYSLWHTPDGWLCKVCYYKGTPVQMASLHETVTLKGYGKVSKARLREMDRRVILPYKKGDGIEAGQYYLGRRGENGKIEERDPRY